MELRARSVKVERGRGPVYADARWIDACGPRTPVLRSHGRGRKRDENRGRRRRRLGWLAQDVRRLGGPALTRKSFRHPRLLTAAPRRFRMSEAWSLKQVRWAPSNR